ncbi:Uncharacterized protein APZ42_008472 [Daphnia magna]|uniref:BED-type domain-containing protein n=1 Tax=Daphnia magna TaxID=35525 RepID=A0A164EM79_9CRUS|nr:Uncharacterized protein APZ42_008472 [Daphnia magna]
MISIELEDSDQECDELQSKSGKSIPEGKQSKYNYCKSTFVVNGTGTMSKHIYTKHPNKIDNTNQNTLDIKGTVASSERAFSKAKMSSASPE